MVDRSLRRLLHKLPARQVLPGLPQHQLNAGPGVLVAVVSPAPALQQCGQMLELEIFKYHYLYIPLEVGRGEGAQAAAEGKTVEVREDDGGVEDGGVDQAERPQVVFQTVPHQDRVRIDEAHQIVLHFF